MSLWSRFVNVFRGERLDRETEEELQSHLEEAIEQGRDPAEVRRAFGSVLRAREESRDIKLAPWLDRYVLTSASAGVIYGSNELQAWHPSFRLL